MGYTKINQFANVTEIYNYDKDIKPKSPSWTKAVKLVNPKTNNKSISSSTIIANRKKLLRLQSKDKRIFKRSKYSIKRAKDNFFRLCHHNNYSANSIHFLTLTFAYDLSYKEATRYVARFMEKISKASYPVSPSYISVPELTKKNRFHFHLLVYNLPSQISGQEVRAGNKVYTTERETRNLQVYFERGYVDILPTTYTSRGIAGYMVKYMAKSLEDSRYETTRGYNCSRNLKKIRSAGGNSINQYDDMIIPTDNLVSIDTSEYNVPYLGKCQYTKIITIKN